MQNLELIEQDDADTYYYFYNKQPPHDEKGLAGSIANLPEFPSKLELLKLQPLKQKQQ